MTKRTHKHRPVAVQGATQGATITQAEAERRERMFARFHQWLSEEGYSPLVIKQVHPPGVGIGPDGYTCSVPYPKWITDLHPVND